MDHLDHVALIRAGVEGAGPRWLELGAGDGEFTLALADVIGNGGEIVAVDRDRRALGDLERRVGARFPATHLTSRVLDFTRELPAGPFDGVLAANSLHFVADLAPILAAIGASLSPDGHIVLVEYDADHGNPYVPYPISFRRWSALAVAAGFTQPRLLHRVPSRFLGSIYGAVSTRSGRARGQVSRADDPMRQPATSASVSCELTGVEPDRGERITTAVSRDRRAA
jgi:SAM-dependent methyltransferase